MLEYIKSFIKNNIYFYLLLFIKEIIKMDNSRRKLKIFSLTTLYLGYPLDSLYPSEIKKLEN